VRRRARERGERERESELGEGERRELGGFYREREGEERAPRRGRERSAINAINGVCFSTNGERTWERERRNGGGFRLEGRRAA
jgi:hypothetical protein